jgi:hypothetical protein
MERTVMEAIGYPGDTYQFIISLAWVIAMLAASMLLGMMLAVACFFLQEAVPSNRRESERSPPHDALMHVVLLAVGMSKGPHFGQQMDLMVRHIRASSSLPVRVHIVTDERRTLQGDWSQYLTSSLPPEFQALHSDLARLAAQPDHRPAAPWAATYMYKPLLHRVLPRGLERVIVLDTDVMLAEGSDLALLWREFDTFSNGAAVGLAIEQQPSADPSGSSRFRTFRSGFSFNGGVQLLHLERMRSPRYEGHLHACAKGECGDFYWLGDQLFYTAVFERDPALFRILPCGWNRQLSHLFFNQDRELFLRHQDKCPLPHKVTNRRVPNLGCNLMHGNQEDFKAVIATTHMLLAAPHSGSRQPRQSAPFVARQLTCATCRDALDQTFCGLSARQRKGDDTEGSQSTRLTRLTRPTIDDAEGFAHMARVLLECCGCGDSSNASSFIEEQVARVVGCLGGSLKGHMPQSHAHHSHDALNGEMRMHGSKKKRLDRNHARNHSKLSAADRRADRRRINPLWLGCGAASRFRAKASGL